MTFNDNFEKQADILNQRFYLLLEDFKKTFLLFKENERYQLNRNKFQLATNQLQNCYKDIVLLDNFSTITNSNFSSLLCLPWILHKNVDLSISRWSYQHLVWSLYCG